MATLNFPPNPVDGQTSTQNGSLWTFTSGAWARSVVASGGAVSVVGSKIDFGNAAFEVENPTSKGASIIYRDGYGEITTPQAHLGQTSIYSWIPHGNGTGMTEIGAEPLIFSGVKTPVDISIGSGSKYDNLRKLDFISSDSSSSSVAGFRSSVPRFSVGNEIFNEGGFKFTCIFGIPQAAILNESLRCFVGMRPPGPMIDEDIYGIENAIGVGFDSTSPNMCIIHNGIKIETTLVKPGRFTHFYQVYELNMYAPRGVLGYDPENLAYTEVQWTLRDLTLFTPENDRESNYGTIYNPGNLPSSSALLAPSGHVSSGGVVSACGISLVNLYIETPM